ncbi:major facilitator superfamily transporter [Thozetella sp. PMI_491]|nr:major facilitator superfamily transporter [Thozetella sp. PMI_491]
MAAQPSRLAEWPPHADVDTGLWERASPDVEIASSSVQKEKEKEVIVTESEAVINQVDGGELKVVGSTTLYVDGKLKLIPTPSPDPKDPLNLPKWRKWTAIGALCMFGALSLAAEMAIAGLLPAFLLEYSGVEPTSVLKDPNFHVTPGNPASVVPEGVTPLPLNQLTLLSTVPLLANGIASYFLIPLSIAVGRRPVLIATATCSWAGGFWAGASQSLYSHIAARVLHGLGSGAVEALLPLIVQDMVFIHQRNRAIAAIIASQGPVLVLFGVLSPWITANYSWRWIYWITSSLCLLAWFGIIFLVPETRKLRSKEELAGQELWPIPDGEDRTPLDYETYGHRTWKDNIGLFTHGVAWKEGLKQLFQTMRSTLFPAVAFCVVINAAYSIVLQGVGQSISFALLAAGIPFKFTGLTVIPMLFSTFVVYLFGGPIADKLSLRITRSWGKGKREPEYNLINLILPFVCGIIGCVLFGYAAQHNLHFTVLLVGTFLLSTGSLTSLTLINTFLIESYPQWAGPVLVTVSSLRIFISFFFSRQVIGWIQERGPFLVFGSFAITLLIVSLGLPILFFTGKRMRQWTAGTVAKRAAFAEEAALTRVTSSASPSSPSESAGDMSKKSSVVHTEVVIERT